MEFNLNGKHPESHMLFRCAFVSWVDCCTQSGRNSRILLAAVWPMIGWPSI
jgi:hypothetical protein